MKLLFYFYWVHSIFNGSKLFLPHLIVRTIKSCLNYINGDYFRILKICITLRAKHNLQGETWNIAFKFLIVFYGDTISIFFDFWIRVFNAWGYIQLLEEINFRNIFKGNIFKEMETASLWKPEKSLVIFSNHQVGDLLIVIF